MKEPWWKNAVVYQVYPRSFFDSNGDGVGDLPGICAKLGYISSLGVDAIWLNPVYRSPQADNGYDIADFEDVEPLFGTMEDMHLLIQQARHHGLRIIMDMVLNHTSDEHRWFLESKQNRTNPKQDWYVWRDGVPGTPPNSMKSSFGGSAWEWCESRQQYYLHQYAVKQPDLNWDNPQLRHALYDMMNRWIDRGISGFRLDVIDCIAKEPDREITVEGSNLHKYIREMRAALHGGAELMTVGEVWSADAEKAKEWTNPDGSELSMVFLLEPFTLDQVGNNKFLPAPLKLTELKDVIRNWQQKLYGKGWCGLAWENHDLPRIVSRWGSDGKYRGQSAKMLAIILYGLQGTPFLYQGEELGMTNPSYSFDEYQDIETINLIAESMKNGRSEKETMNVVHARSRDSARTPMQWNTAENAGFTSGRPWLRVNPNYSLINVEEQENDRNSVLNFYRRLIALRRKYRVFRDGRYQELFPKREDLFAYQRIMEAETLLVVANFTGNVIDFPCEILLGHQILSNYPNPPKDNCLRPFEAIYYVQR